LPEPEGVPAVLLAGRLLWDKGVGVFVEAARLLKQKMDVRFILVGEVDPGNPASIPLEVVKNWVAEGAVEWWGWQSDMRVAFAASHLVTLPSLGEGIPTILLEAASCGRPIVATNVPGCRDVVQDDINGLLVPPNDPDMLASAVAQLLTNPLLRSKMSKQTRLLAEQRFSSKHIIGQTLNLYLELLNGG
jgi:glycosyltransferase involved in cell wall biosynthesis